MYFSLLDLLFQALSKTLKIHSLISILPDTSRLMADILNSRHSLPRYGENASLMHIQLVEVA